MLKFLENDNQILPSLISLVICLDIFDVHAEQGET